MAHDQKLQQWFDYEVGPLLDPGTLKTIALFSPVDAFVANAKRIDALSWIKHKIKIHSYYNGVKMPTMSMDDFWSLINPEELEGFDALMSAELVLAWTAFETLAGDLWEASLNTHLETLVSKAWEGKQLPFKLLRQHEYDLKNKMGTILRAHLKNPFQSLGEIGEQYRKTFKDGLVGTEAFWADKDLASPFHLRNLVVHRAGNVDESFRENCKNDPRLLPFPIGEKFWFDGELLSHLITGLLSSAKRLIESVDSFITRELGR